MDGITSLILANPHHRLEREFRTNSIEATGTVFSGFLEDIFNGSNRLASLPTGHPLSFTQLGYAIFNKTGRTFYPTEVVEERKRQTVDTNENRFVKYFLQSLQRRLYNLEKVLKGMTGGYLNPDIENQLEKIKKKVSLFLSDPLRQDVGLFHLIPAGSQVLQRRDSYRQLFRLYSLLQLITRCDFEDQDFENLLETNNTPTLFEYWSFFVVKDILERLRRILFCQTIVFNEPLEQKVHSGIRIQYEEDVSFREAIRNVVGAFILYPGEKAVFYQAHNGRISSEGVGALPLKPEAGACSVQRPLDNVKKMIQNFLGI